MTARAQEKTETVPAAIPGSSGAPEAAPHREPSLQTKRIRILQALMQDTRLLARAAELFTSRQIEKLEDFCHEL